MIQTFYLKDKKVANGKAFQKFFLSHSRLLLEIQTNQAVVIKRKVFFYELWNFRTNIPIEWHIKHAFLATRFDKDLIFAEMLSH